MPELETILSSLEAAYDSIYADSNDAQPESVSFDEIVKRYGAVEGVTMDGLHGTIYKCHHSSHENGKTIVHEASHGRICSIDADGATIDYIYDVILKCLIPCIPQYTKYCGDAVYHVYEYVLHMDHDALRVWISHEDTPNTVVFSHDRLRDEEHYQTICDVFNYAQKIHAKNNIRKAATQCDPSSVPITRGYTLRDISTDNNSGVIVLATQKSCNAGEIIFMHGMKTISIVRGKIAYIWDSYSLLKLMLCAHGLCIFEKAMQRNIRKRSVEDKGTE